MELYKNLSSAGFQWLSLYIVVNTIKNIELIKSHLKINSIHLHFNNIPSTNHHLISS